MMNVNEAKALVDTLTASAPVRFTNDVIVVVGPTADNAYDVVFTVRGNEEEWDHDHIAADNPQHLDAAYAPVIFEGAEDDNPFGVKAEEVDLVAMAAEYDRAQEVMLQEFFSNIFGAFGADEDGDFFDVESWEDDEDWNL